MITNEFKQNVLKELLKVRKNFDGSNKAFAKQYGINETVYSRLANGTIEGMLKDAQWAEIARRLGISISQRVWNIAETDVLKIIKEEVSFCKEHSKSKIFVDACGIGKTFTAKYLSRTLKNCFYVRADRKKIKGEEYFHYSEITILEKLDLDKFINVIEKGYLLVDFDARTGHNHGTKFRLRKDKLPELYEVVKTITK